MKKKLILYGSCFFATMLMGMQEAMLKKQEQQLLRQEQHTCKLATLQATYIDLGTGYAKKGSKESLQGYKACLEIIGRIRERRKKSVAVFAFTEWLHQVICNETCLMALHDHVSEAQEYIAEAGEDIKKLRNILNSESMREYVCFNTKMLFISNILRLSCAENNALQFAVQQIHELVQIYKKEENVADDTNATINTYY